LHQFTVRLLGSPFPLLFAIGGHTVRNLPGGDNRPYGEVTVVAPESETLGAVLDHAAVRLGLSNLRGDSVSANVAWLRFYESSEDHFAYDEHLQWAQQFTTLDASGRVKFGRRLDQVLVSDLLRTAEVGLLAGDPLQPYLIPTIPQGGVEPWSLDWPTLIGYLQMFWTALGAVTTVDGAISLAQRLGARLERAPAIVAERNALFGGTPELLWDVFRHRPVLPAEAAEWLACTTADAETLLLALGLDDRGDGLWEPEASDEAHLMSMVLLEFRDEINALGRQQGTLLMRLQHLVETGQRAPRPDVGEWERQFETSGDEADEPDAEHIGEHRVNRLVSRAEWPLDRIRLDCSCDDRSCQATARITFAGGDRLRFELERPGHFEVPSGFLQRLAMEQLERYA
jgi:hypothetical protein